MFSREQSISPLWMTWFAFQPPHYAGIFENIMEFPFNTKHKNNKWFMTCVCVCCILSGYDIATIWGALEPGMWPMLIVGCYCVAHLFNPFTLEMNWWVTLKFSSA